MKFGRDDYDYRGALDLIPEDEPVFLLRIHDPASIEVLRSYAHNLRISGAPSEVYERVWSQADRMEAWARRLEAASPHESEAYPRKDNDEDSPEFLNKGYA